MSYFLSNEHLEVGNKIELDGAEAQHVLRSRRLKVGDAILLQDPVGLRWITQIVTVLTNSVIAEVKEPIATPAESTLEIVLCQALVEEKALDLVIQKATELGVTRLVIFNADKTPTRLNTRANSKLERWQKIALEAAKQCDRVLATKIIWCDTLQDALTWSPGDQVRASNRLFLSQHADKSLLSLLRKQSPENSIVVTIFVGPEGGWSKIEEELFRNASIVAASMGPRILRTETAAITGANLVQTLWGDMG